MEPIQEQRIYGTGYSPKLEELSIGDTFLKECVVNMWDFPPEGAFWYFSKRIQMTLRLHTKIGEDACSIRELKEDEVPEWILNALAAKGATSFRWDRKKFAKSNQ